MDLPASAGDTRVLGLIPGFWRSPGGGSSNPLQYSCLENPVDKGAWWASVQGVAKTWTWLSTYALDFIHLSPFSMEPRSLTPECQALPRAVVLEMQKNCPEIQFTFTEHFLLSTLSFHLILKTSLFSRYSFISEGTGAQRGELARANSHTSEWWSLVRQFQRATSSVPP